MTKMKPMKVSVLRRLTASDLRELNDPNLGVHGYVIHGNHSAEPLAAILSYDMYLAIQDFIIKMAAQ